MSILTIHAVNPTGMFSYGPSDNIPILNKGLVHLQGINEEKGGDSNGSGKSSLFNAICELLFQENPTEVKGDEVINSVWNKGMAGRIMFTTTDGNHYRVTYTRSWKDPYYEVDNNNSVNYVGTGLFLDKYDPTLSQWQDHRGTGIPDTRKRIKEIIGLSYNNFLAISFLSPRVGSKFLRGTNKDRMNLLSGITGVEEWDLIIDKCRKEKKTLKTKVEHLQSKVNYENGSIGTLREQLESLRSSNYIGVLEAMKVELEEKRDAYSNAKKVHDVLQTSYNDLLADRDKTLDKTVIESLKNEDRALRASLSGIERNMVSLPVLGDPMLTAQHNNLAQMLQQNSGVLNSIKSDGSVLLDLDNCPTCNGKISQTQKDSIIQDKKLKIEEVENTIAGLTSQLAELAKQISEDVEVKRVAEEQRVNELYVQAQDIKLKIQEISNKNAKEYEEYSSFDEKIQVAQVELQKSQQNLGSIENEGHQKSYQITNIEGKITEMGTLEGQIQEKQNQVSLYISEMTGVQKELNIYLWLIDNIPSIKLFKLSDSMAEITNLANDFLQNMGDSMKVNVSAFHEKVSKKNAASTQDMLKDEVNLEIYDGSKRINPKLYSDGEIAKVSLAVAKALHEMARKSGQGCNLMLMDEIFGYMDANNSQRVAQSLQGMMTKGTVFLTDNSDKVRDLVQFDHSWLARKRNGCTVIETSSGLN